MEDQIGTCTNNYLTQNISKIAQIELIGKQVELNSEQ